jgi:mxaJ protein
VGAPLVIGMLLLTLSAAVGATPPLITTSGAAGATTRPLRVCADPNNMPFSNARGEGFENGRARLVAGALGAPLEYAWQPQRRGFVRNTLAAGRCDVMMEAPIGYDRADETIPYYRSTYVFVSRRDRRLRVRSFDDPALRRLRIGVEVIGDDYANSPPAELLARRGLAAQVVGFPPSTAITAGPTLWHRSWMPWPGVKSTWLLYGVERGRLWAYRNCDPRK